jgi:hypothetical protein
MVPLDERTAAFTAGVHAELKADGITHILCLAEGLECFPGAFEYLQVRSRRARGVCERRAEAVHFNDSTGVWWIRSPCVSFIPQI